MGYGGKSLRALTCIALVGSMAALAPGSTMAAAPSGPSYSCTTSAGPKAANPLKIMLAGDSVTAASTGDYSWRYWLWRDLVDRGANIDFVGSFNDAVDPTTQARGGRKYLDCNFDQDQEARTSARLYNSTTGKASYDRPTAATTDPTLPNYPGATSWIRGAVAKYKPAVLVAFVGNLDIGYPDKPGTDAQDAAEAIKFMTTFINQARLGNPQVDIVLTTAATPKVTSTRFTRYNKLLAELATKKTTAASRLVLAKMPSWTNHTWDGYHPDANGEVAIAAVINVALHKLYVSLPAKPSVLQKPKIGPRRPAVLDAKAAGSNKVNLTWTLPPGGDRTIIYARNETGDGPWVKQADLVTAALRRAYHSVGTATCDVPCTSFTVEGLSGGTTYEFEVRAAKGQAIAADIVSNLEIVKATGSIGKVASVTAVPGARSVSVKWPNLGNATGYDVHWRLAGSSSWAGTATASGSPRVVSGLAGGKRYEFQVRARNGLFTAAWSDSVFAVPKAS